MGKNLQVSILFDFYGDMLTQKQHEAIELYYNHDLSLGEIADNLNITRQGVRDNIKRSEAILYEFEKRLGLVQRFHDMEKGIEKIVEKANQIISISYHNKFCEDIKDSAEEIIKTAKSLYD